MAKDVFQNKPENTDKIKRILSDRETYDPQGRNIELRSYLEEERPRLVLKPSWGYGGKGVVLGCETEAGQWRRLVGEHLGDRGWIVQQYIAVPALMMPAVVADRIVMQKKYFNLSPFVFGGQYAGVLGRFSDKAVINVSAGGGVLPIFEGDAR